MYRKFYFVKVFTLLLLLAFASCEQDKQFKVVGVKDGDTIVILTPDNKSITVRLAEVDCPEKTQAYGQAAKQFTSNLCFGKGVKISGNQKDRYGRTVALVILDNGTNVNYELVKNGYAWQYTNYSHNATLAAYQQYAKQHQLGLWQDANPTPPWEYRQHKRQQSQQSDKPYRYQRKHKKHKSRKENSPAFEYSY